ncbi:prephenate dehydrogenase [Fusibacter paucivorans]|uniref:prephenate dehydrogenase n=1 Tax=Fusibacter paucivorans TaxID=76009 RepID=UPI0031B85C2B
MGLGLIGGSIAKAVKANTPHRVIGFDIDAHTLNFARDEGILDEVSDDAEHVLSQGDIVFICLYPKETITFIREHYRAFKDGAIITDCAGLKMEMTAFFNKMVKNDKDLEFIGGHPMAGSEKKGYENASSTLLEGAPFILTPHEGNTDKAVEKLTSLLVAMQFGEVTQMTAQVHDELVAYTSHLPHIIANALLVRKPSTVTKSLEGGSFRDVTRVGKMNTLLWQELIMSNQENVLKYLDDFNGQINAVKEAIQSHNTESLVALFEGH